MRSGKKPDTAITFAGLFGNHFHQLGMTADLGGVMSDDGPIVVLVHPGLELAGDPVNRFVEIKARVVVVFAARVGVEQVFVGERAAHPVRRARRR